VLAGTQSHGSPPDLRLQKLIEANRAIVAELSLSSLLRRVVECAREISGAEYAALGVVAADGTLEQFIHCGMDAETVAAIGEPPKGRGLIGALLVEPRSIRLASIADDPRSSGVPLGHPPISSFLGVPIRSATSLYGNLYLTNRRDQSGFSGEDESLLHALAATASIAIENARMYEQSHRRQQWLRASAEISHRLLGSDAHGSALLEQIASTIRQLAAADTVCLCLPTPNEPGTLEMVVVSGRGADDLRGLRYPADGSVTGEAMQQGCGVFRGASDQPSSDFALHFRSLLPVTNVMALPLKGLGDPRGALLVCRTDQKPFTPVELEMATAFTRQATLALELADARGDQHQLMLLEDRARIARDLHEHVVQKLFGAGLTIQGTASLLRDVGARRRLADSVITLDDAIRSIRTSIFELQELNPALTSVRSRVVAVIAEVTPVLGFAPHLQFDGPVDTMVDEALATEVEAVLRESLTNVAKHAQAHRAWVEVGANSRLLCLTVSDDGVGLAPTGRRSGLSNLRERAARRGGHLELDPSSEGGLLLRWTIPLP
jgi:signal transduction histidine kinase